MRAPRSEQAYQFFDTSIAKSPNTAFRRPQRGLQTRPDSCKSLDSKTLNQVVEFTAEVDCVPNIVRLNLHNKYRLIEILPSLNGRLDCVVGEATGDNIFRGTWGRVYHTVANPFPRR